MKRACPTMHILAGGDAKAQYENRVLNLKEQIAWVGIDDPWRTPGEYPTQSELWVAHQDIVDTERAAFIDAMQPSAVDLIRDAQGEFVNYRVQAMWDTWLMARLGFKRGSY